MDSEFVEGIMRESEYCLEKSTTGRGDYIMTC